MMSQLKYQLIIQQQINISEIYQASVENQIFIQIFIYPVSYAGNQW